MVFDHRSTMHGPRIAPIHHGRRVAGAFPYGDAYVGWVERSDTHRRDAGALQSMGIACGSTHPTRLCWRCACTSGRWTQEWRWAATSCRTAWIAIGCGDLAKPNTRMPEGARCWASLRSSQPMVLGSLDVLGAHPETRLARFLHPRPCRV